MSTPEPRHNPDNDSPDVAGVACRGCAHFILDASEESAFEHQGWWWCVDCFNALPEVVEGLADALRADELRDDALAVGARGDME